MKKTQSIFLLTSPIGISNIRNLQKWKESDSKILVNIFNLNCEGIEAELVINHMVPKLGSFKFNLVHKIMVALSHKKLLKKIDALQQDVEETIVFFQDYDVTTNYVIHYFRKDANKKAYIIEDGMVNYIPLKRASFFKAFFKKVFYNSLGFSYKFVRVSATAIEQDFVSGQFVRSPEYSNLPAKSLPLLFDKISYDPLINRVLILGQEPYIGFRGITKRKYLECLNCMINAIITTHSDSCLEVFYKPHRAGQSISPDDFLYRQRLFIIDDTSPIEELLECFRPMVIYSFNSSALINIKLALDAESMSKVDVFSNGSLITDQDMKELLHTFGIKDMYNEK